MALRRSTNLKGHRPRSWLVVGFGRHKGKTLPQIVLTDPDWFFWAVEDKVFKGALSAEASEIDAKARRIRPIWEGRSDWAVEYSYLGPYGSFGFSLVEADRPKHEGSSWTLRQTTIDLSAARAYKDYDKTGGKFLINGLKFYRLGGEKTRITRKLAEDFFADESNFLLE